MRSVFGRCGCAALVVLISVPAAWASSSFADFFLQQKIGQEITVTGEFFRFPKTRRFFRRDPQTGDVEYFTYFGASVVPTTILGNGALSQEPRSLDAMLLLYPDEEMVKDLPEAGDNIWFTGTLLGYQYGASGITEAFGIGGRPYLLLKRFSPLPPAGLESSSASETIP